MRRLSLWGALAVVATSALAATPAAAPAAVPSAAALGAGCFTFTADGRALGGAAARLDLQPTGFGTYLLHDARGRLLRAGGSGRASFAGTPETAGVADEWQVLSHRDGRARLRSVERRRALRLPGTLTRTTAASALTVRRARGCRAFPEAEVGATGRAKRTVNRDGTIFGFADTHLHVTGDMRAGGAVVGGKAFDDFGIARALGGDADRHGADGAKDLTGNLLRDGVPFGTHDTDGWPSFDGWPTADTNTHQQVYFRWLERAWRGGLRLITATTVEDEQLCRIQPVVVRACDEGVAVKAQIDRLRGLERYVDAQAGGPGRGWFRLVKSAGQAREVMRRGRLAVVIGVEGSFPLGCRVQPETSPCTIEEVDGRLDRLYELGVRSMFIAHWADNGFAGAALQGGAKGKLINAMHRLDVGRYFTTQACPDPRVGEEVVPLAKVEIDVLSQFFPKTKPLATAEVPAYPPGRQCNATGLTPLGEHLVKRMMEKGMLIEVDHLSHAARARVMELAKAAKYPLVSGHNETGGAWTPEQLKELIALGGVASQTLEPAADLGKRITARTASRDADHFFGVGLGTDTGGFASLPGPAADAKANPLRYPFTSYAGTRFAKQRTGTRTFDLNADGMAHYGLLPDLLADVARRPGGAEAMGLLFRSAESYAQMWRRAERRGEQLG